MATSEGSGQRGRSQIDRSSRGVTWSSRVQGEERRRRASVSEEELASHGENAHPQLDP
jgi:hypothetical protein